MRLPGEGLPLDGLALLHRDGGGPGWGRGGHLEGPGKGEVGLGTVLGLRTLLWVWGSGHPSLSRAKRPLSIHLPGVQHRLGLPLGDAGGKGCWGLAERRSARWGWRDEVWRSRRAGGGQGRSWRRRRCHGRRWRHRLGWWRWWWRRQHFGWWRGWRGWRWWCRRWCRWRGRWGYRRRRRDVFVQVIPLESLWAQVPHGAVHSVVPIDLGARACKEEREHGGVSTFSVSAVTAGTPSGQLSS